MTSTVAISMQMLLVRVVSSKLPLYLRFLSEQYWILDRHAPIRIFQMRKNYSPYLSEETEHLISARNSWKGLATKQGYRSAEKIAKELQGHSLEMYFLICLMLGLESSLKAKVFGKIFLIVGHF